MATDGRWWRLERRDRWLLAAVLGLALAVRLLLIVATDGYRPRNDAADYDRLAQSLLDGHGFGESRFSATGGPTALRPPGYPVFLAGVHAVVGDGWDAARAVQALVGALTVAGCGLLGLRLGGRRTGLLAGVVAAVYLPLVMADTALLSEVLFLPLLLAAVLTALRASEADDGRGALLLAVVAGGIAGAAVLVRPIALPVVVVFAVLVAARRRWQPGLTLVAVAVLVILPWSIRNTARFDTVVPLTTQTGFHLAGTYNATADGDGSHPAQWRPANLDPTMAAVLQEGGDEAEIEARLRREALRYLGDHPTYVGEVAFWNLARTFSATGLDQDRSVVREEYQLPTGLAAPAVLSWFVLVGLAIAGIAAGGLRRLPLAVWLVPVVLLAAALVTRSDVRYRLPLEVFLVPLAALALDRLVDRVRGVGSGVGEAHGVE